MRRDVVIRHPNPAKFLLINEAYFAECRALIAQLRALNDSVNGTILANDVDVRRLRASLNRKLAAIPKRYEKFNVRIDAQECAQMLLDFERDEFRDLVAACRFYKGEPQNPFENNSNNIALFWNYERGWVEFKKDRTEQQHLLNDLAEFIYCGLMSMDDTTPKSLQAILWNRYCHWNYWSDADVFERWYRQNYLGVTAQRSGYR